MALLPLLSVFAGCTFNASPIHAELDEAAMRSKILAEFHLGMDAHDVRDKVRSLDLEYSFETMDTPPCDGCGERGFVARVEKPGFAFMLAYLARSPGELMLWLDGHNHLAFAVYKGRGFEHADGNLVPIGSVRWEVIP